MGKIFRPAKVCIVLSGRYSGRKVVVIKQSDEGTKDRPYPHAIVAGVDKYPRKVTKRMGAKKVSKRSKVKPFVKAINYNHLMPTRYALELESLKGSVSAETLKEESQKADAKKAIKKVFEQKYQAGQNKWFFTPLRMLLFRILGDALPAILLRIKGLRSADQGVTGMDR
ncbi:MAG: hypothetical protein CYPHOPRED_004242 [Cyphobasidiales sp. Tagirdzhanova-0007]|nr:MAG: hypothetical protein CYPHOPRED_004242 [Cyphobasidiales sp. Tagirdzhanova-0007]